MPATYSRVRGCYDVSCTSCGTTISLPNTWNENEVDINTGRPAREVFAYHSGHQRWYTRCRECDRAARRQRRAAGTQRVPGMSREALGIARPFGVELECAVPGHISRDDIRAGLSGIGCSGWRIKGDGSIHVPGMNGVEIVSPALRGEDGEEQVRKVCRMLRQLGASVNRTCGTHVHHDANDLNVNEIKRVARSWRNNQSLIDGLVSPSRRGGNGYCRHLTSDDLDRVERIQTLEQMKRVMLDRYRTLNLTSYGRHGTIEVRQHQGTLDAEKIISWLRFGQAVIDSAKASDSVEHSHSSVRSLFTTLGERLDETARTFLLGRAVEFDAVAV